MATMDEDMRPKHDEEEEEEEEESDDDSGSEDGSSDGDDDDDNGGSSSSSSSSISNSIPTAPFCLHEAAEAGDVELIRQYLSISPEDKFASRHIKIDQRDMDQCTPLHTAILYGNYECMDVLIDHGAELMSSLEGSSLLHVSCSMGSFAKYRAFAEKAITLLMKQEFVNPNQTDDLGNTAMHLCAQFDLTECAKALTQGEFVLDGTFSLQLNVPNYEGLTALHVAAQFHAFGMLAWLLDQPSVKLEATDSFGRTPYIVAAVYNNTTAMAALVKKGANKEAVCLMKRTANSWLTRIHKEQGPRGKTLVSWSKSCFDHMTCGKITRASAAREPIPPENVNRLKVLLDQRNGLLSADEFASHDRFAWSVSPSKAELVDVLRCHDYNYINRLQTVTEMLKRRGNYSLLYELDSDTSISASSFDAALVAAGMVCNAVDKIVVTPSSPFSSSSSASASTRHALCLVRPPGHHAGPTGYVPDSHGTHSHGFCLLNNVAIGAGYARCMYRHHGIKRIAIVDFDVHHGNGTEAIVRNLVRNTVITKTKDMFGSLITKRPSLKPWLNEETDADDVFFVSVHGHDDNGATGGFYPGSGKTTTGTEAAIADKHVAGEDVVAAWEKVHHHGGVDTSSWGGGVPPLNLGNAKEVVDIRESAVDAYDTDDDEEKKMKKQPQVLNVGINLENSKRAHWRQVWRHAVIPKLLAHKPDMLFISAGFDAHKKDILNHGYVAVDERDYYWLTRQLVKVANTCCPGHIVSCLEGGYRIHGKVVSPFGRSVAAHLRALSEENNEKWDPDFARWERKAEDDHEERLRLLEEEKLEKLRQMLVEDEAALAGTSSAISLPSLPSVIPSFISSSSTSSSSSSSTTAVTPAAVVAAAEVIGAVDEETAGGGRRARRTRTAVDYVALNAEIEMRKKQKRDE